MMKDRNELVKERLAKYVEYIDLTKEEYDLEYQYWTDKWVDFLNQNDRDILVNRDFVVHDRNLYEVIRRVDKREVYYKVFHGLSDINEYKSTALFCYWLITLKPFYITNKNSKLYNSPNELFAYFLILASIRKAFEYAVEHDADFQGKVFKYPSQERISDIIYNLKYCGVTREAMISFVETFADNWGVGITYILKNKKEEQNNNSSN